MRLNIALLLAAAAAVVAACAPSGADADRRLRVVATTTQVGSIADEIGGEAIDLTVLLEPGVEAHDFELTPAAAAAIEEADLILASGAGLESWLRDALATIGADVPVAELSEGVALRTADGSARADDEQAAASEGDDHAGEDEVDPHYWLSAPNAIVMVRNARDAVTAASPERASGFAAGADGLIGRLEAADEEIRRLMDQIPEQRRGIVTNHDALGYFIDEYGLRFVGSVFPSLDVSAEPNPAQLAELIDTMRAEGVVAVFSESAVNPRLAQALAEESGAEVVDEPLYTDSLGPPGSGADTLDGMLAHNARVIHDALAGD